MTTYKPLYGSSNQSITCTMASLGNAAARSCAAVDNTTALNLDALVTIKVTTGAAGVLTTGSVTLYAYGTTDGGATYGGGETGVGTDATVTLSSPPNIVPIGVVNAVAANTAYQRTAISVASAFGGTLPAQWGLVIVNNTGAALAATGNALTYQGIQVQSA